VLLSNGVIVAKRKDEIYQYVLYQMDRIYIELKYHKDHKTMPGIRGFTSTGKSLLRYIEHIDISALLVQ
jgi:dUTPase